MSFSLNSTVKKAAVLGGLFAASVLSSCEKTKVGPDDTGKNPGNGKNEPKNIVMYYDYIGIDGQTFNDNTVASISFHFGEEGSQSQTWDAYIPWSGQNNYIEFAGAKPLIEDGEKWIDKGAEVTIYAANANDVFIGKKSDGSTVTYKPKNEKSHLVIGQVNSSEENTRNYANGKVQTVKGQPCKMGI